MRKRKNETGVVDIDYPNILPESILLIKNEFNYTESDLAKVISVNETDFMNYFSNEKKVVRLKAYKKVV